jgi:hypothetical protein
MSATGGAGAHPEVCESPRAEIAGSELELMEIRDTRYAKTSDGVYIVRRGAVNPTGRVGVHPLDPPRRTPLGSAPAPPYGLRGPMYGCRATTDLTVLLTANYGCPFWEAFGA